MLLRCAVPTVLGAGFRLPTEVALVFPCAMDFEAKLEAFYRQLPLQDGLIIDVGAHSGRHTLPLAKLAGPLGTVHAFEPIPSVRGELTRNLEAEGIGNTVVYPFALSHEEREVAFHYLPGMPQESGLKARHAYNAGDTTTEFVSLRTRRLDDILTRADFLRIDIEGGELDMLNGARELLAGSKPIVAFECGAASFLGYHDQPEEIFGIFNEHGYGIYSIMGDFMASGTTFREASYAQNYWDFVAMPAEKRSLSKYL
jgi:FkbM family methyltransferase